MNRPINDLWKIATLCLLLPGAAAAAGHTAPQDTAQAQARLTALRARIENLTQRRAATLAERDAQGARLRDAELAITAKRRALSQLQGAVLAVERSRAALRAEQSRTQAALDAERSALSGQILAAYKIGRQEQLKMLLSQTDPAAAGRMLAYYGYFGRARAAQIDQIRERQQQLQALGVQIDDQSAKLQALQDEDQRALADLSRARAERAQSLAAISREVKSRDQELADLKRQEQALEALLVDLARVLQDFPTDNSQNFNELRGRLPWPVAGHIVARGHDAQNGVLIDAARGAQVRAPYFGRVVYADWLQGLGLLLIIGHDGGYMSLYGHAEVLYKSVGDRVAPGDVIASLDDTEGKPAQLYFEIRQGRKPLDPRQWLKRAP
ncbi:MAG TPA: peptidoglycan DD-metalloendopeptidase family protein [Steroidobacteraceae bacterium]|nr:peptidoglycan DD-metalloendopeptidase family protein [Steroidobacteraceae bacterium]